jgi:catechol 2,3-dioxygenase-like lactoylglutathione lyase family enzyme
VAEHVPSLRSVVLDTTDARRLAEFYRQLLGYEYRPGDETPEPGEDWLMLVDPRTGVHLGFQQVERLEQSTWPDDRVPQQLHLDFTVRDVDELERQHERALELGARVLDEDRRDDPDEPIYVYADPDGHPFCIFVVAPE